MLYSRMFFGHTRASHSALLSSWGAVPLLPRTSPARRSSRMNTCTIFPLNSFRIRTYAMGDFLSAFGMNTYAKYAGGGGVPPTSKNQGRRRAVLRSGDAFPSRFPRPTSPLTWTCVQSYHYSSAPLKRIVLHAEWLRGSGPTKPRQPDQRFLTGRRCQFPPGLRGT
jgi:hypothetical protein